MGVTTAPEIDIKFDTGNPVLDKKLLQNFAVLRELLTQGNAITGSFTTTDGKTITVTNGIVTGIV